MRDDRLRVPQNQTPAPRPLIRISSVNGSPWQRRVPASLFVVNAHPIKVIILNKTPLTGQAGSDVSPCLSDRQVLIPILYVFGTLLILVLEAVSLKMFLWSSSFYNQNFASTSPRSSRKNQRFPASIYGLLYFVTYFQGLSLSPLLRISGLPKSHFQMPNKSNLAFFKSACQ